MEAREVQPRRHGGFLGAIGELAARMGDQQAGESIDGRLPAPGGARPVGLRLGGLGGRLMSAHLHPEQPGYGGLAADGELFGTTEGGVTHVTITAQEFVLGVDGLREALRGFGVTTGGERLFGLRFQSPPLLPEVRRFEPAEAGIQQGPPTGISEAGELPTVGDLLLAGDRPAEPLRSRRLVRLGQDERRGLESDGFLAKALPPEKM